MSRLITRMEKARARVASRITNELVLGTMTAIAATAAAAARILTFWLVIDPRSFPSKQPGGSYRQDHRHRRIKGEIGDLGKRGLAKITRQPAERGSDRGAAGAPHPADDHDREREGEHLEVQPGIDS